MEQVLKSEYKDRINNHLLELVDHEVRASMANFSYFLTISEIKALIAEENFNLATLLQPFFSSAGLILENLINWNRIFSGSETRESVFKVHDLANETIESIRHLCDERGIKLENKINKNITYLGDQRIFSFLIKNIVFTCMMHTTYNSSIKLELFKTLVDTEISIVTDNVFIDRATLKTILDIDQHKRISGKNIGLLLCNQLLQYYGEELKISYEGTCRIKFTFSLSTMYK